MPKRIKTNLKPNLEPKPSGRLTGKSGGPSKDFNPLVVGPAAGVVFDFLGNQEARALHGAVPRGDPLSKEIEKRNFEKRVYISY
jgi:hypothetical protein